MTSVSPQQYAPNYAYEMPSKSAPAPQENSAQADAPAQAPADSAASRQPMTAQQRGQFSTHKELVNSPSSTTNTDPARIAQLSRENNQLRDKLVKLVDQFTPIITGLQQQVADLAQQVSTLQKPKEEGSTSNQGAGKTPAARQGNASPEAPGRAGETPISGAEKPRTFEQVTAENDQLRETIDRLKTQFTAVVTKLQEQIQALSQKVGEAGTSVNQVPAATTGPKIDSKAPSDTAPTGQVSSTEDVAPSAKDNEPAAPATRSVDDLIRENEQLHTRIDQMMAEFTQVITQLQQQIEQLSAQIKAQMK